MTERDLDFKLLIFWLTVTWLSRIIIRHKMWLTTTARNNTFFIRVFDEYVKLHKIGLFQVCYQFFDERWRSSIRVIKHNAQLHFLKCQSIYGFLQTTQNVRPSLCDLCWSKEDFSQVELLDLSESELRNVNFSTKNVRRQSYFLRSVWFVSPQLFYQKLQN